MLKLENTEIVGWEAAIRGMRNPMNSWGKSDSLFKDETGDYFNLAGDTSPLDSECDILLGDNDHKLMESLADGGPVHAKYRRMIAVYVDITAPLYWWKEFDTYKVGTVANSCSTMHKIADKVFELEDFSCEKLDGYECVLENIANITDVQGNHGKVVDKWTNLDLLKGTVGALNHWRYKYINETENAEKRKHYWWQMIQLLPSSYNQRRTIMLNYEVLANIYKWRRNHKLDEWHAFCDWIEELPCSEFITGRKED